MMEIQIQQFYQFLELFKAYLDNPRYQKILYDFGLSITLDESNKILSYVLSYISFNPVINQHPNFEKCFLFFLNLLMYRLMASEKYEYALKFLMISAQQKIILFKLLEFKHYAAAEQVLKLMSHLSEDNVLAMIGIQSAFQAINQDGNHVIFKYSKHLNHAELMEFTHLMMKCKQYSFVNERFLLQWLASLIEPFHHIEHVFVSIGIDSVRRKCFLDVLLKLIDYHEISPSYWKRILYPRAPFIPSILEQVILNQSLPQDVFVTLLEFIEKLYMHHHLSYDEYTEILFKSSNTSNSPLHQILLMGNVNTLVTYLDFLDAQYLQSHIHLEDIKNVFLSKNRFGFTTIHQAVNNYSENITLAYLPYLSQYFNRQELFSLLSSETFNPVSRKIIKVECGADKRHYRAMNNLLLEIKRDLFYRLSVIPGVPGPRTSGQGFFSPIQIEADNRYSPIQFGV